MRSTNHVEDYYDTGKNYMSVIFDKIGVNNRVELALWYEARLHERSLRVSERT
jgi:hypothetical protein